MNFPNQIPTIKQRDSQQLQMKGINLTDNYSQGQMQSCRNISTKRYPYITTADKKTEVELSFIPTGYKAISVYAWEKMFVVSDEPATGGGYKCYYNGAYCGNAKNTTVPKQYAVVNSKLVMFPDKVYFNLYDKEMQSYDLATSVLLKSIKTGTITFKKAVKADGE